MRLGAITTGDGNDQNLGLPFENRHLTPRARYNHVKIQM